MHTVFGKTLEGNVLGTMPGHDSNTFYTSKISDHIRIRVLILAKIVKGLLQFVISFGWRQQTLTESGVNRLLAER